MGSYKMGKVKRTPCPFGEVVFTARSERGISRYRLAKLIGRTPQQLAKLERGENEPVLSTLVMIAGALEMDPCTLLRKTLELLPENGGEKDISEEK